MDSDKISLETQLLGLRNLTASFGCLHDLQLAQIKQWPFAVDPHIEKSHADVDLDNKMFHYHWTFPKAPKIDKKYKERLAKLLEAVRFMLGPDWGLKIQNLSSKTTIFTSEDVVPAAGTPAKTPRRRSRSGGRLANRQRKTRS